MRKTSGKRLAKMLNLHPARGIEATIKAQLISAILEAVDRKQLRHNELAKRSAIPRSAVTGILSGSLQKVTLDRVLRLMEAAELTAEVRVRDAA